MDELGRFAERRVCRNHTLKLIVYLTAIFRLCCSRYKAEISFQTRLVMDLRSVLSYSRVKCSYAFIKLLTTLSFGHNGTAILSAVKEEQE